jgi:hypothetical protein
MLKKILFLLSTVLLLTVSGCSSVKQSIGLSSYVTINKLAIVNLNYDEVTDFRFFAPKSNTYLSAGYITGGRKVVMLVFKKFERKNTGLLEIEYVINGKKINQPLTLVTPLTLKEDYDVVVYLDKELASAAFE